VRQEAESRRLRVQPLVEECRIARNRFRCASLVAALAALGALTSCHNGPGQQEPAPGRRDGAYEFVAHVRGVSYRGTLYVVGDTILVDSRDVTCHHDSLTASLTTMRFRCDGLSDVDDFALVVDRHRPVMYSSWTGTVQRPVSRSVCDQYVTNSAGRTVCAASHMQTEYQKETISGSLTVQPSKSEPAGRAAAPPAARFEAISLLGDTLRSLPLPAETRARYERQLAEARGAYDRAPSNADSIIWYGRRLAYLGTIREAIAVYTRGVALHQENPWFYRHRGHRLISIREFDLAIADLDRAWRLASGKPDEVEPDGQPNAANTPIGTLQSNINYHLALAYYLKGDFARALPVYERELAAARNDDRRVSIVHWLYMSLRRLGRDTEAARVLVPIRRDMHVIENGAYHRLLLLYKGELPQDSVLTVGPNGEMSVTDATAAYGVANWHLYNGRRAEAERLFRRILAGGQWGAFGYIAAEAELARVR
jgi:tetratricopeptide (TPR) repeat protein